MRLRVRESNRWCRVEPAHNLTAAEARRQILREQGVQNGFSILQAPLAPHDDTVFKVLGKGNRILVAVACYDSVRFLSPRADRRMTDDVEIFFDPLNDGLTWFQAHFDPPSQATDELVKAGHRDPELATGLQIISHIPSQDAYSSRCFTVAPISYEWKREEDFSICPIMRERIKWLFAWFKAPDIFRNGSICGFNICRNRACLDEFSSWNYCSGNGSQDATAFGHLYIGERPRTLHVTGATLRNGRVTVTGSVEQKRFPRVLQLVAPDNERTILTPRHGRDGWQVDFRPTLNGRYRLTALDKTGSVEPRYVSIDVPSSHRARSFRTAVLFDSPMCIIPSAYTPARLDREMRLWSDLGVHRIHWIEYWNWPSFWAIPVYNWQRNYLATQKACGDWTRAAIRAAHRNNMEFVGDLKTFDLGGNSWASPPDGISTVQTLENWHVPVIPEIAAHQEWTQQANPDWQVTAKGPAARLCFYSEKPIPRIRPGDVRLFVSNDNRRYSPYRRPFQFRQYTCARPHERWTPAGTVPDTGTRRSWVIELSGLRIDCSYAALVVGTSEVVLHERGYRVARAWNANGEILPLTTATNGSPSRGFFFWKGWQGWNNVTENLLNMRPWDGRALGLAFREDDRMQTLLEPAFKGAHGIWLNRLKQLLARGADGVSIRTYCQHNGPMHYLKFAYAQPVIDTFRSMYGRAPRPEPVDYERIRRIRGECYTEFMRSGKRLASAMGRRFMAEIESGVEVPPHMNVRMQLPLEWEKWIREGIVDEIRLKYWTAENPFIHERVLPLARRHGVPVQLISRCLHTGLGIRTREIAHALSTNACSAGFDSYCFYEQQNLLDWNPEGVPTLKGPVRAAFEEFRSLRGF